MTGSPRQEQSGYEAGLQSPEGILGLRPIRERRWVTPVSGFRTASGNTPRGRGRAARPQRIPASVSPGVPQRTQGSPSHAKLLPKREIKRILNEHLLKDRITKEQPLNQL